MTTTTIRIGFHGNGHESSSSAHAPSFREGFLHAQVMLGLPPAFATHAHVTIESGQDFYSGASDLATLDEMLVEARQNAVTA